MNSNASKTNKMPPGKKLHFTIAICTWNRAHQLDETLTQLSKLEVPDDCSWSVLVINNRSTDHTAEILDKHTQYLPIQSVFEPRQGKSHALNTATKHIKSDWILWTDDDVLIPANWIASFHRAILQFPEAAFFGGPTITEFRSPPPTWVRESWQILSGVYGERNLGSQSFAINDKSLPWGANFAIRTDVQIAHPFDTRLGRNGRRRLSGEENELCRQLLRDGCVGYWLPTTQVKHVVPMTMLTRRYVARYYFGLGQTLILREVVPNEWRRDVRTLRRTVRASLSFAARSIQQMQLQIPRLVNTSYLLGQTFGLLLERWLKLQRPWWRVYYRLAYSHERTKVDGDCNPNRQNTKGETPLHLAVRQGDANTAAQLLQRGADWRIQDLYGRSPLELGYSDRLLLHEIRQLLRRSKPNLAQPRSSHVADWLLELEHAGIVKLPGMILPPALARMRAEFENFTCVLDEKLAKGMGNFQHYDEEEHWWDADRAYISNNAFKYSTELVQVCSDERLMALIEGYFGKPTYITRAVAMRYLAAENQNKDMFAWHHDMEEKRLKVMVLLTDIGITDQHMSYVLGSQKIFHPYSMFCRNTCTPEYCADKLGELKIYNTIGRAGDVFVFDSNGAHRGNRRLHAKTRDTFFVEFCPDISDVWGADFAPQALTDSLVQKRSQFNALLTATKKWHIPESRKAPTWVETLPNVSSWLHE